jgi:putative addiction module killer protein
MASKLPANPLTDCSFQATKPVIELIRYQRKDGTEPFTDWLRGLRDKTAAARIRVRLHQIEAGNFGDCNSVGPGDRVTFGRSGGTTAFPPTGGDKKTQPADIVRAQTLWTEWKERQP